jgi:ABC-type Fe3+-hydroxamate transport system, periplasmic component
MTKSVAILLTVALLASSFLMFIPSEDVSADSPFTITDVEGNEVSFEKPADYAVVLGLGMTLTMIELGMKDKIIGVDSYSVASYASNAPYADQLEGLESYGNFYNAGGRTEILTKMVQEIDENSSKYSGKDIIILAPNYSYIINETDGLIKQISNVGAGFKVVLVAKSGMMYDDITPFVGNIGKIFGATNVDTVVENMELVKNEVTKIVDDNDLAGAKALHLSSTDVPAAYQDGKSILLSMVTLAGGSNVGGSASGTTVSITFAGVVQIIGDNPNVVIFLDAGNPRSVEEFRAILSIPSVKVIKLAPSYNNTCPSTSDGLWAVASALYPDHFSGLAPTVGEEPKSDILLYAAVGTVAAVLIVSIVFVIMRRS